MSNPTKQVIAIDAMGGDFGPSVTIPAAHDVLVGNGALHFLFFGDEAQIDKVLQDYPELQTASEVIHTDKVISNDEKPSAALRTGKNSSMRLAIESVKEGRAHAIISGGNTGALMATSKVVLRMLPGIKRPAIASLFPTYKKPVVMLDLGANITCDAEGLVQFAILGSMYSRAAVEHETPRVGILNIGSEDMKGHDELRVASSILSQAEFPGEYTGFVEGNNILSGDVDVVVTDGFTGNVALKVAEGTADFTSSILKTAFKSSLLGKLGALIAMKPLKKAKSRMDHRYYNGGIFLGLNGICVKSHGGMDRYGFSRAITYAAKLIEEGYNDKVAEEIERLMGQDSFVTNLAAHEAEGS